jgi:hypothetical protein
MHSRASAARRSPLGSRYGSSPKNWTEKRDRRDNANQKQSHARRASLLVIQPQASSHCETIQPDLSDCSLLGEIASSKTAAPRLPF